MPTLKSIFLSNKEYWLFGLILVFFLLVRLPAIHAPYHQDEYKWAQIVAKGSPLAGTIPHPPLSEKIYTITDRLFGNANLRYTPLIFSILNFCLIYFLVKKRFGLVEALGSVIIYTVTYYSVLASLMVDTDGQVLPAIFLFSLFFYFNFIDANNFKSKIVWGGLLFSALVVGFLVKLSFIIPALTFIFDYLYLQRRFLNKKFILNSGLIILGGVIIVGLGLLNARYVIPNFSLANNINYWKHFVVLSHRNYFQVLIQCFKSVIYLSPMLVLFPLGIGKDIFYKTRIFFIFIVSGLIFYLVLFDFSLGALDRYLQFLILPLSIICSVGLINVWRKSPKIVSRVSFLGVLALGGLLFALQFLPHIVPPQHPKTDWIYRIISLKWNFLFPLSGGSGPLGFYVSFALIGLSFVICLLVISIMYFSPAYRRLGIITLVMVSLVYNFVFIEEYLFGLISGNSAQVLTKALEFIKNDKDIEKVITYNDTGTYELTNMGKYQRRIYADPSYENGYKKTLNNFKGYYLVVDIPRLNQGSIYEKYFSTCRVDFIETSINISATVFNCKQAKDLL